MVMYWYRCSICGKYTVTLGCSLSPLDQVCPTCCILYCNKRGLACKSPVWFPELEKSSRPVRGKATEKERVEKVLLDLLKKLE